MSRASIATPCPAPIHGSTSLPIPVGGRRSSATSAISAQDDTTDLEYTRALHVELKKAKPRRRSTFQKRENRDAAVTIFEDVMEEEELPVQDTKVDRGGMLLGRPAQRLQGYHVRDNSNVSVDQRSDSAVSHAEERMSVSAHHIAAREGPQRSRVSPSIGKDPNDRVKIRGGLIKEPRRRTIFVPAEDTTILTIHPGAKTTERLNDTFQLPGGWSPHDVEHTSKCPALAGPAQQARRPRMSLATAPKRLPLQHVVAKDGNAASADVLGKNGGKENLPPGMENSDCDAKSFQVLHRRPARHSLAVSRLLEPTAASQSRSSLVKRNAVPLPTRSPVARHHQSVQSAVSPLLDAARQSPPKPEHDTHARRPSVQAPFRQGHDAPLRPLQRKQEVSMARLQQYPILSEDLAQPDLYEDVWLSHQEVALTELINQMYTSAQQQRTRDVANSNPMLRERLIGIYHRPEVAVIHKRLQASLLCGALSRPRDVSNPPDPAHDLGLRKRFLGLWLDGYEADALCIAAEVVFGRQLPGDSKASTPGGTLDPHRNRRALIGFLETFLVEVDDVEAPDAERGDDPNVRWRKTMLRSLMLIWLLDQAKLSGAVQGCLFKASSTRKSSVTMLHALAGMFTASVGDIVRVLRHLKYEALHEQDPLDEVRYCIDNIAVELRDGVRLTRLVEILLYSPSRLGGTEEPADTILTIHMPDLTVLESALYDIDNKACPRILSQHLKMPCLGRAQKTYNVQIAISALQNHGGVGGSLDDVTADDIVDGHREKTISLLWSLVSNFGLEHLVDFQELEAEISRETPAALENPTSSGKCGGLSQSQQESLLKKWAAVHAVRQGIRIGNLTTSFADGKAYAAILDAYSGYMNARADDRTSLGAGTSSLQASLRALGCSNAFAKQMSSNKDTIPSRKTTISNLAFLASRLLPLARQHNAAKVIQRAFRLRQIRRFMTNRIALMRLAHACATVVQTQDNLMSAAVVLQRAWRNVLEVRIRRLNVNTEVVQAAAKGWLARRKMRKELNAGRSASQSVRVMGGWS